MKKINSKIIGMITCIIAVIIGYMTINAASSMSATVSYTGNNEAYMGTNYSTTIQLTGITGGSVSATSARFNYDKTFFELVSATDAPGNFTFSANVNTGKFNGLSMDGNYLSANSNLLILTLKPLKTGTTSLTITDCVVSDNNSQTGTCNVQSKTVEIKPARSSNAFLSSLTVSGQTLTPAFNKNTTSYSVSVANTVTSVSVSATCEDAKAQISYLKGQAGNNNLNVGANQIQIKCTAEDTSSKTYNLTVNRAAPPAVASSDANLKSLSVDGYTMTPSFNANTTSYSVTIPNEATSVKINATQNHNKAKVEITGSENFQVGNNTVTVTVTAEDGTKKNYTINVTREAAPDVPVVLDSDATLKSLTTTGGSLSPAFNSSNNIYSLNVGSNVSSIDVNAVANSDKAHVEVSGNTGLQTGINTVLITVTAENGNKNTYIINVNRKAVQTTTTTPTKKQSNDNYLNSLTVEGGSLSPKFNKDVVSYSVTVPYETSKLNITFEQSDSKSKVEILENEPLKVGEVQQVYVKVTAEDGSVRMYTINATRSPLSSNAYLKSLSIKDFNLNETFDKNKLNYSVVVDGKSNSLNITALPENEKAKVEILGNSNLKVGTNVIMISVTDENGFSKIYQLDVVKTESTIFGIPRKQFFLFLLGGLTLFGVIILLAYLLSRKKKEEPTPITAPEPAPTPTIDFKPEFNFGSKNGTDDDVVYPGGILNQGNGSMDKLPGNDTKKLVGDYNYKEADYKDAPFNFYDDTVTKDELVAAIKEGMNDKNSEKLKMLLKQEELNRMKKEMQEKESRRGSDYFDRD